MILRILFITNILKDISIWISYPTEAFGAGRTKFLQCCKTLTIKFVLVFLLIGPIELSMAHSDSCVQITAFSHGQTIKVAQNKPNTRFKWLFDEKPTSPAKTNQTQNEIFTNFDSILKGAREQYLSNKTRKAGEQYRKAIKELFRIINILPSGHPGLNGALERTQVFEESAMKILGPADYDISPEISKEMFHLMEEKRTARRLITLKMADIKSVFDVPSDLMELENKLLQTLLNYVNDDKNKDISHIKNKLKYVRSRIAAHSQEWAPFFLSSTISGLLTVQTQVLRDNELILDINLLPDRALMGYISRSKCSYFQFRIDPENLSDAILDLQNKVKGYTKGDESSFMGHAWKEASRRVYRELFSITPELESKWTNVYVLPDKSIWYLPFSILLDPSDQPLGYGRTISMLPSARMLVFHRSLRRQEPRRERGARILGFESTPWIPQDQLMKNSPKKRPPKHAHVKGMSHISQLILSNRSYPKPSKFMLEVDKIAPKSALWVGPAATLDNWLKQKRDGRLFTLLAVPAPTPDKVSHHRQPTFIFSFDKKKKRRLMARDLFAKRHLTMMLAIPNAWVEMEDERSAPLGQGPLLMSLGAAYSGAESYMINYSNPEWGEDEPYLMELIEKIASGNDPWSAIKGIKLKLAGDGAYSFTGRPPAWAGWIIVGCPGPWDFRGTRDADGS